MAKHTYSHLRENLAAIWDEVEDSRTAVIVARRGHSEMAILPADELRSLEETAHLLRSPVNAARLLTALARSRRGGVAPTDLARLRRELGIKAAE